MIGCLHHLDRKTADTRSHELLELFGLTAQKHQRMREFSKGMRQKVLIAAALIHRPEVLFLELAGGRTSAACAAEKRTRGGFWSTSGEARAVALLVRSQFRHDHRFRMGVLGLLPFTLLYMMGVRNGAIADPFAAARNMQAWPLTMRCSQARRCCEWC